MTRHTAGLFVLLVGCVTVPRPVPQAPARFDAQALEAWLAAWLEAHDVPGATIAFADHGEVVLARGVGQLSRATGAPVTEETAFAIGSVTKQFTCAAALRMEEEGRLSFVAPIGRLAPELPDGMRMTALDLLQHVAGVHDYYPLDFVDERMRRPTTPDAIISTYGAPLDFAPGTRFSYSNTGYTVVARAVEKVAGVPFAKVVEERLLRPLQLSTARMDPPPQTPGLAQGHSGFALSEAQAVDSEADGWLYGAAGLWMSAKDLVRWDLALMEGMVLRPQSWTTMTTPRTLADGRRTGYACGLNVRELGGQTVYTHSGAVSGFLTFNAFVPATRSAVAVSVNRDDVDTSELFDGLVRLVSTTELPPPVEVQGPPARVAAEAMARALIAGKVDRSTLGTEYSAFLTEARLATASRTLGALGQLAGVDVERTGERGGMEVSSLRLRFASNPRLKAVMFRSRDGRIQEFLISR